MLISDSTARAFENVAARQADLLQAFTPGAIPRHEDVTSTGASDFTLDPLSVSLPSGAYLLSRDDKGGLVFSRDGSLQLHNGVLADATGRPILGRTNAGSLAPLRLDPVDNALGVAQNVHLETDGTVSYERAATDPKTGTRAMQRIAIGRVALARFPAGTKLVFADSVHASAPPGVAPHIGAPADNSFAPLTLFSRERSGVDLDLGLQRLEDAYLALDALRAAGTAQGGTQKTAMDLLK